MRKREKDEKVESWPRASLPELITYKTFIKQTTNRFLVEHERRQIGILNQINWISK